MPTVAVPAIITTPAVVAVAVAIVFSSSELLLTLSTSPSCPCGVVGSSSVSLSQCHGGVVVVRCCDTVTIIVVFTAVVVTVVVESGTTPLAWLNRPCRLAILAGAVGVKAGVVGMPPASQSDLRWWDAGGGWKLVRLAAFSRMWPPGCLRPLSFHREEVHVDDNHNDNNLGMVHLPRRSPELHTPTAAREGPVMAALTTMAAPQQRRR
ncbi:hypothetical protein EDB89DRAFT_1910015 [Lactarius sanguifluus]|nr:hypothetical protein EDB89DRAFT_1910015 [Lactarius sanguifluus]